MVIQKRGPVKFNKKLRTKSGSGFRPQSKRKNFNYLETRLVTLTDKKISNVISVFSLNNII